MNSKHLPSPREQAYTMWLASEPPVELYEKRLLAAGYRPEQIQEIFRISSAIRRDLLSKLSRAAMAATDAEPMP
jgi:hypothetical protein